MTCGIPLPAEYLAKVLTKNQEMKKTQRRDNENI
jgi:hypothetical protein